MVDQVPPIAKAIYLCDDVLTATGAQGKVTLVNVFDSFRPQAGGPPYLLGKLCVFAALLGMAREYTLQVLVVHAQSGRIAFASSRQRIRIIDRLQVANVLFRIMNCPFPEAGVYLVELHCDGIMIDDRRLTVASGTV